MEEHGGRPELHAEVAAVMRDIFAAVAFLHQHGVVHCDLKPENVLLSEEEEEGGRMRPLLCDFGSSRDLHAKFQTTMTTGGGWSRDFWPLLPD